MAVAPGSGWFGDPATAETSVATSPADVAARAATAGSVTEVSAHVTVCRACPRLVAWREQVAIEKRRSFAGETYWGRPVAGFGAERPRILVLGLAPAAHGANRTGRMFTGDRSGDWLYASLYRVGLASQPTSVAAGDGLTLRGVYITAPVHCAPPANKPTPTERDACRPWLVRDLQLLAPTLFSVVALGGYAWQSIWPSLAAAGFAGLPIRRPVFGHGAEVRTGAALQVLGCYHPSQQNTFTGKLTPQMVDDVLARAAAYARE
jgi:uracil-DNA glycosylase family 4